jgi:O-succinylhomoserine sulfhydrylase
LANAGFFMSDPIFSPSYSHTLHPDSLAVRHGQVRTAEGEHNDPLFLSSSFVFDSAAEAAARFMHDAPGNVYSRFTNPTVRTFEQRLAALEGASYCAAMGSGMAAILSVCLALLKQGDHVVVSRNVFGSTVNLFTKVMARFGVEATFLDLVDFGAWEAAIGSKTRFLFLETPSNPLGEVGDIRALADLAHAHDCRLVVDNVLCTPALQRPIALGADLVVHSATKYLDGQGRCVGGAVVTHDEEVSKALTGVMRTAGPTLSPFNAWVFLNGLETLSLRMHAHSVGGLELARWLQDHPGVEAVYYGGLKSHPQHGLAAMQQDAFGGIVTFTIKGGQEGAWSVVDASQMLSITANFGDAKSTITHPATTTHGRLSDEERVQAGITENMLRLSVGLEQVDDIKTDLERGLAQLRPGGITKRA